MQRKLKMKKTITLQGKETQILSGLRKVKDIYKELSLDPATCRLYLQKSKDIKIPLSPDDYIIIHGEEQMTTGDYNSNEEYNLTLKTALSFTLNGKTTAHFKKTKVTGKELCLLDKALDNPLLFVTISEMTDTLIQNDWTLVVQDKDVYWTIPFDEEKIVDLEKCAKSNRQPPKGQKFYKIKIDGEKYKVSIQKMTGAEILGLAGKTYDEWSLNQKFHGGRRKPIELKEIVDFSLKGIERFETVRRQAQQGGVYGKIPSA